MSRRQKFLNKIMCGTSDTNIPFDELCDLLRAMGFDERIRGSHHIYTRDDVEEILNLQPREHLAKPYQVKLIRTVFLRYKLGETDAEI